MAGNARQTSVETPAIMSFLRPVPSTALANRGSSNALTVVRLMIEIPDNASVNSGMIGPHISGEVAVTTIGKPSTLAAFDIPVAELKHNVVALANAAKVLGLPIVVTATSPEMWGPIIPE